MAVNIGTQGQSALDVLSNELKLKLSRYHILENIKLSEKHLLVDYYIRRSKIPNVTKILLSIQSVAGPTPII